MVRVANVPADLAHGDALARLCASFGEVVHLCAVDERRVDGAKSANGVTVDVGFEERDDALAAAGNLDGMEFGGSFLRAFVVAP